MCVYVYVWWDRSLGNNEKETQRGSRTERGKTAPCPSYVPLMIPIYISYYYYILLAHGHRCACAHWTNY